MRFTCLAVTVAQVVYAYTLPDGEMVCHRWRGVVPRRIRPDTDLRSVLAWAVRAQTGADVDWQDLHLLETRCWPRHADRTQAK